MSSTLKAPTSNDPSSIEPSSFDSSARLKLLAHLVEQTSDVLTAADIDYKPVTWNKAAEKVYGLKAEQVIGKDIREFIHLEYNNISREKVRDTITKEGEWRGEAFFTRPTDQKPVTLLMTFKQLKEDGKVSGYLISATDITDRKEAECRLKESEQRFKEMADSSPAMIWMCDENNETIYNNKKWFEFTGKSLANTEAWESLIHKDDVEKIKADYYKAFKQQKQITLIYRLLRFDGVYRWVQDISVARFLSDGKFVGYIGTVVDIEGEKQKQEQLLYQATVLENVSDIVVTTDLEFRVKTWNAIAEHYYCIKEADAIGKKMNELVNFTFHGTTVEQSVIDVQANGMWKGEVSIVSCNGETKYFFQTVKFVHDHNDNKIGYLAVGRDITEKKLAEEKLKESELFYRTLIADSLDGMILLDAEGKIIFSSPSVKNVLGYDVKEVMGRNGFEFVHPEDIAWAFESFQKEVVENPDVKFITVRLLKKNGQWLWCTVRGHNLLNNPHVNSIVVYFHDDTLRKQARDALKESEKRFRSLIRDLQVGVFLSDVNGTIIMCNKALAQMLSVPEEMIVGKSVYGIMSADMINEENELIPVEKRPLTRTIQSRQTIKNAVIGVLHPITKERSWIMVNSDPILDEEGNLSHVVCSVMDLTERKKLEKILVTDQVAHQKQLVQATIEGQEKERREIGKELHDNIGQQLTTIKLFLDFAKTSADETTLEMVNMALKGVAGVINEVRAMSRSLVPYTLKDLGLIDSITELIDSLERTQSLKIEFAHFGFNENLLPENQKLALFRIIQEQMNNVIKHAQAKNVTVKILATTSGTILEIRDDGSGFDSKKIRKGLGFINIRNRAELFNGKAEIQSKPGQGCCLTVSFPQNNTQVVGV